MCYIRDMTDFILFHEDKVDFESSFFPIPDNLHAKIGKNFQDLAQIIVEKKAAKTSFHKVNGFNLSRDAAGRPILSGDKIASAIVAIARADVDESATSGKYRAAFFHFKDGVMERTTTCSFPQTLGEGSEDGDDGEDEATDFEGVASILEQMAEMLRMQIGHNEGMQQRLLAGMDMTQAGHKQLMGMNATLMTAYHQGIIMQQNALQQISAIERANEDSKLKHDTSSKFFDMMRGFVPAVTMQGAAAMKNAGYDVPLSMLLQAAGGMGGGGPTPGTQPGAQPGAQQPRKKKRKKPAPTQEREQDDSDDDDGEEMENPLTEFAHAIRDSLDPEQWFELSEVLKRSHMRLLKGAMTGNDDETTLDAILELRDALVEEENALEELMGVLTDAQKEHIGDLLGAASSMEDERNGDGDDEDDEDDGEGGDD